MEMEIGKIYGKSIEKFALFPVEWMTIVFHFSPLSKEGNLKYVEGGTQNFAEC